MAYDQTLAARIRAILGTKVTVTEKTLPPKKKKGAKKPSARR
jgi:hypothetical protein